MFYYYYPHLKNELGSKKYEILKEALAVFTDPKGTDKPEVKKLERYFKEHLNEPINKIMEKDGWKNYF